MLRFNSSLCKDIVVLCCHCVDELLCRGKLLAVRSGTTAQNGKVRFSISFPTTRVISVKHSSLLLEFLGVLQ